MMKNKQHFICGPTKALEVLVVVFTSEMEYAAEQSLQKLHKAPRKQPFNNYWHLK